MKWTVEKSEEEEIVNEATCELCGLGMGFEDDGEIHYCNNELTCNY